MENGWIWSLVTIGGPVLFGLVVIWAVLNNRRSKAEIERSERATARLYEEQDRIDKAADRAAQSRHAQSTEQAPSMPTEAEPARENISTRHQAPGDAARPRDTLDR